MGSSSTPPAHSDARRAERPHGILRARPVRRRACASRRTTLQHVATFVFLTGWRVPVRDLPLTMGAGGRRGRGSMRLDPGSTKNAEGRTFPYRRCCRSSRPRIDDAAGRGRRARLSVCFTCRASRSTDRKAPRLGRSETPGRPRATTAGVSGADSARLPAHRRPEPGPCRHSR